MNLPYVVNVMKVYNKDSKMKSIDSMAFVYAFINSESVLQIYVVYDINM